MKGCMALHVPLLGIPKHGAAEATETCIKASQSEVWGLFP